MKRPNLDRLLVLVALVALASCATTEKPTPPPKVDPPPVETPEPVEPVWPDEAFRAERPKPAPLPDFSSPVAERFTLGNGLEVVLVTRKNLPVVAMDLSFPTGSVNDSPKKPGVASLTGRLLNQGTKKLDRVAFKERQSDLGSSVWAYTGREESGLQLRSLSRNLAPTLDLFVELLLEPGMRKDDLERVRKELLADMTQSRGDIRGAAGRVSLAMLFGPTHPYGHVLTDASVGAINVRDCTTFTRAFKPKGARLFVSGNVERAELEAMLNTRLATWRGKAPRYKKLPKAKRKTNTIYLVDVPDAPQSRVLILSEGPERSAEDFPETYLMARILGGSFSSRINMNLREDKGWAYGARANFSYLQRAGYFTASSNVQAPHTAEALVEILAEMDKIGTKTVTDAELTREREGAILSIPSRFSTSTSAMGTLSSLTYFSLPLDYYDNFPDKLKSVDKKKILKSAKKHVRPEDVVIVVAGDKATVMPQLEKLLEDKKLPEATIVQIDADGKALK